MEQKPRQNQKERKAMEMNFESHLKQNKGGQDKIY